MCTIFLSIIDRVWQCVVVIVVAAAASAVAVTIVSGMSTMISSIAKFSRKLDYARYINIREADILYRYTTILYIHPLLSGYFE